MHQRPNHSGFVHGLHGNKANEATFHTHDYKTTVLEKVGTEYDTLLLQLKGVDAGRGVQEVHHDSELGDDLSGQAYVTADG